MPQKIEACCEIKQRGKSHTEDDADVFAFVAGQHLQRDPVHRTHSSAPTGGRTPSAASIIERDVVGQHLRTQIAVGWLAQQQPHDRLSEAVEQTLPNDAENQQRQPLFRHLVPASIP